MIKAKYTNRAFNNIHLLNKFISKLELETGKRTEKKSKRKSQNRDPNSKTVIEDWKIVPEVWQAQEAIYNAHTKHDSHLKVDPTYKEVLKAGYRWNNMLVDIRDFYFKWQV